VGVLLNLVRKLLPRAALMRNAPLMLSIERVRRMRQSATVANAGVVVSLGLSIALTVMVTSFRGSITSWLDTLLPADLYVRTGQANNGSDALHLDQAMLAAVGQVKGVAHAMGVRVGKISLQAGRSPVVLIARPLPASPADVRHKLPLVSEDLPVKDGQLGVYVSEAMAELYGLHAGGDLKLPLKAGQPPVVATVRGVWRDYAHQQGAFVIGDADYQRLTGDKEVNDMALWLAPEAQARDVEEAIRQAAVKQGLDGGLLLFSEPREIRQSTLKVFDRSFAVTYWLQAVAMGIGLFGVSASFSAQVLARRKEFGLLSHLGLTRTQILRVLAGEGAALTAVGAALGLALGIAVSLILVYVVNPQSFHWTMDMLLPWPRLAAMCLGLVAAGALTAWMAGRAAVGHDVVAAVKEDW
jgi:putative ABC transport system permease protein